MKKIVLFFTALILGTSGTMANSTVDDKVAERNAYRYDNSFIFVEDGITFSVYPDGEFDFYIENQVSGRRDGITMNSGFDYSPYAQYDDYGAVIQVENVPIYYDHYGRVTQVGNVDITYNRGRVRRVGGMNVYYNRSGFYDYHTGYINTYNRFYTYRPFHSFFARPSLGFCLVFNNPYRRYYSPFRYTYYNPYRFNQRRAYATFGKTHKYNKVRKQRASVYRNDKRVAVRSNRDVRTNRNEVRSTGKQTRNSALTSRRNSANTRSAVRGNTGRSNTKIAGNTAIDRSKRIKSGRYQKGTRTSNGRTTAQRSTTVRSPIQASVSKKTVTRTPRSTTVTRSTAKYNRPQSRTSNQTVRKTTSSNRNTTARSSAPKRTVSNASSRTTRSSGNRSSSSRSSRRQ